MLQAPNNNTLARSKNRSPNKVMENLKKKHQDNKKWLLNKFRMTGNFFGIYYNESVLLLVCVHNEGTILACAVTMKT